MLHIRNTLQNKKYLENGTLSRLLTFTIMFYERFYIQQTYRYTNKLSCTYGPSKCQRLHFVLIIILLPSYGLTQEYMNFLLHFLYQSVPFITRQVCELLLSPQLQKLSSNVTSPYKNFMLCMNHTHCVF